MNWGVNIIVRPEFMPLTCKITSMNHVPIGYYVPRCSRLEQAIKIVPLERNKLTYERIILDPILSILYVSRRCDQDKEVSKTLDAV